MDAAHTLFNQFDSKGNGQLEESERERLEDDLTKKISPFSSYIGARVGATAVAGMQKRMLMHTLADEDDEGEDDEDEDDEDDAVHHRSSQRKQAKFFGANCWRPRNFPTALLELTSLRVLRLRRAGLTELPPGIGKLVELQLLDIAYNQLTMLPEELADCTKLVETASNVGKSIAGQYALQVDHNPLHTPPLEIVSKGGSAVLAYLKGLKGGKTPVFKTKVMLVGLGGVGKTALANVLRDRKYDHHGGQSTDGIEIVPLEVPISEEAAVGSGKESAAGETMTFMLWDFAGQEVYYTTHQFFLSHRAVYIIVWNVRLGTRHSGLDYWLASIKTFAPDAPILVVGTRIDEVPMPELPEREIRARYPQVEAFVGVSAKTGQNIPDLQRMLVQIALRQDYMGMQIANSWLNFEAEVVRRRALPPPAGMGDYCHIDDFVQLAVDCAISSIEEAMQATEFLGDLGVIIHINDHEAEQSGLNQLVVTRSQWLADVMKRIVTAQRQPVAAKALAPLPLQPSSAPPSAAGRRKSTAVQCAAPGCKEIHRSATGFCHLHRKQGGSKGSWGSEAASTTVGPQAISESAGAKLTPAMAKLLSQGVLPHSALRILWREFDLALHPQLLELMRKFELVHALPSASLQSIGADGEDLLVEAGECSLVPCLLPEQPLEEVAVPLSLDDPFWNPGAFDDGLQQCVTRAYCFSHLPTGAFGRVQVRLQDYAFHGNGSRRVSEGIESLSLHWRYGSVLQKAGHQALIVLDQPGLGQQTDQGPPTVRVAVRGTQPENLLSIVQAAVFSLQKSYIGLSLDVEVPCPMCSNESRQAQRKQSRFGPQAMQCHVFSAEKTIRQAHRLDVPYLQCQLRFHQIRTLDLLRDIPARSESDFTLQQSAGFSQVEALAGRLRAPIYVVAAPKDTAPSKSRSIEGALAKAASQSKLFHVSAGSAAPAALNDDIEYTPSERLRCIRATLEAQGDRERGEFGCFVSTGNESIDIDPLAHAQIVLVMISPNLVNSQECIRLIQYAVKTLHKTVLPVVLDGPNGWFWTDGLMGLLLAGLLWEDMTATHLMRQNMPNLISRVSVEIKQTSVASEPPTAGKQLASLPPLLGMLSYCWANVGELEPEDSAENRESSPLALHGTPTISSPLALPNPREVQRLMAERGVRCWLDVEQLGSGPKRGLFEGIHDGLRHAKFVIICVSAQYAKSENCMMECRYALKTLRLPVFVVVVGSSAVWEATEVGMLLADKPLVDCRPTEVQHVHLLQPSAAAAPASSLSNVVSSSTRKPLSLEEQSVQRIVDWVQALPGYQSWLEEAAALAEATVVKEAKAWHEVAERVRRNFLGRFGGVVSEQGQEEVAAAAAAAAAESAGNGTVIVPSSGANVRAMSGAKAYRLPCLLLLQWVPPEGERASESEEGEEKVEEEEEHDGASWGEGGGHHDEAVGGKERESSILFPFEGPVRRGFHRFRLRALAEDPEHGFQLPTDDEGYLIDGGLLAREDEGVHGGGGGGAGGGAGRSLSGQFALQDLAPYLHEMHQILERVQPAIKLQLSQEAGCDQGSFWRYVAELADDSSGGNTSDEDEKGKAGDRNKQGGGGRPQLRRNFSSNHLLGPQQSLYKVQALLSFSILRDQLQGWQEKLRAVKLEHQEGKEGQHEGKEGRQEQVQQAEKERHQGEEKEEQEEDQNLKTVVGLQLAQLPTKQRYYLLPEQAARYAPQRLDFRRAAPVPLTS
jgi:GTPase SAR1 family protein